MGRITGFTSPEDAVSYTYDDKGKVTSVTAPDHSESFVYDDKDVLTSKTVDGTTYRFAIDTIAVINNGLLEAIFIHPIEKIISILFSGYFGSPFFMKILISIKKQVRYCNLSSGFT